MRAINVWLALSTTAQDIVIESLRWDEEAQGDYTGPLRNRSRRLFEYMQDEVARRRLFATATLQSIDYNLWSIDFFDEGSVLQDIRDEIDFLIAEFPNQIAVLGAWDIRTGQQVGGGTPLYPIPNYTWRFMPAELGAASNTDLTDVNLLFGQTPRDFS